MLGSCGLWCIIAIGKQVCIILLELYVIIPLVLGIVIGMSLIITIMITWTGCVYIAKRRGKPQYFFTIERHNIY